MSVLAAAAEGREAGPIGLVVILCLVVALIVLIRSMNRHLRKVPGDFSQDGDRSRDVPRRTSKDVPTDRAVRPPTDA